MKIKASVHVPFLMYTTLEVGKQSTVTSLIIRNKIEWFFTFSSNRQALINYIVEFESEATQGKSNGVEACIYIL